MLRYFILYISSSFYVPERDELDIRNIIWCITISDLHKSPPLLPHFHEGMVLMEPTIVASLWLENDTSENELEF